MKISILQHVPFEGPGMILDWGRARNQELSVYRTDLNEFPEPDSFDLLIILGGPMSANDDFDWIRKEKILIKQAIDKGSLVFGICLGAQLIAKVLGSTVKRNPEKEIGWFPIKCAHNFLKEEITVFHWHGETFELPSEAELLASSEACKNQAFAYKDTVLGIQFHLEMGMESIEYLIQNFSNEIILAKFIQTAEEMLTKQSAISECRIEIFDLLDGFALRVDE